MSGKAKEAAASPEAERKQEKKGRINSNPHILEMLAINLQTDHGCSNSTVKKEKVKVALAYLMTHSTVLYSDSTDDSPQTCGVFVDCICGYEYANQKIIVVISMPKKMYNAMMPLSHTQ